MFVEKKEFINFCKEDFKKRGFKKIKKGYYLDNGKGILVIIYLQRGSYGKYYYINCNFNIGSLDNDIPKPIFDDANFFNRIKIMSKANDTIDGKQYMTEQIPYEEYAQNELQPFFDKYFEKMVIPVIIGGKQYIIENIDKYEIGGKYITEKREISSILEDLKNDNKVL